MLYSRTFLLLAGSIPFISARPFLETRQGGGIVGVATFNDYANQAGGEVCKNAGIATTADNQGIYKAAAGDISPDLSGGLCDGSQSDPNAQYDMSKCTSDGGVVSGYPHPSCNNAVIKCGTCYGVANFGAYPTDTGAQIGKSIVVQIVDACPAGSALNYCKAKANPPIPADERCGQGNALDIDYSAYKDLTGTDYSSASSNKANLKIHITPNVPCQAGAGGLAGTGGLSSIRGSSDSTRSGTGQSGSSNQGGTTAPTQGSVSNSQSQYGSVVSYGNPSAGSSHQSPQQQSSNGNGSLDTSNGGSGGYSNPQTSGQSGQSGQQQGSAGYNSPQTSGQNGQQPGNHQTSQQQTTNGGASYNTLQTPPQQQQPNQGLPGGGGPPGLPSFLQAGPPGRQSGGSGGMPGGTGPGLGRLGQLFGLGGII